MPHLPSKPHVVSTLHPSHHASTWQLPSRVTRLLHDCLLSIIWSLGILVLAVNVILLSIIDASTCPTSNAAIPLCHLAPITTTSSETNSKDFCLDSRALCRSSGIQRANERLPAVSVAVLAASGPGHPHRAGWTASLPA